MLQSFYYICGVVLYFISLSYFSCLDVNMLSFLNTFPSISLFHSILSSAALANWYNFSSVIIEFVPCWVLCFPSLSYFFRLILNIFSALHFTLSCIALQTLLSVMLWSVFPFYALIFLQFITFFPHLLSFELNFLFYYNHGFISFIM